MEDRPSGAPAHRVGADAGGVGILLVLALWFSVRLAAPLVETDMHLVEHPPGARMPGSDSGVEPDVRRAG